MLHPTHIFCCNIRNISVHGILVWSIQTTSLTQYGSVIIRSLTAVYKNKIYNECVICYVSRGLMSCRCRITGICYIILSNMTMAHIMTPLNAAIMTCLLCLVLVLSNLIHAYSACHRTIYIYIYIYIFIYTYIYTYWYIDIYLYIHVYIHTF